MKPANVLVGALLSLGTIAGLASACDNGDGAPDLTPDAQSSSSSSSSSSGDAAPPPPEEDGSVCATDTYGGDLLPLELTVLFDVSSSLCFVQDTPDAGDDAAATDAGDDAAAPEADAGALDAGDAGGSSSYDNGHFDCTDLRSRWPATSSAMRSFLSSPSSAGLTVAVRTFGPVRSWTPPTVENNLCQASDYSTPDFEATELPSQQFANRVASISVKTEHPDATQTQTGAVIAGATLYTKARKDALAGSKGVAMVLVTDGNPEGCDPSLPVPNYATEQDKQYAYAAAAGALANGVKLYVLHTGGDKALLDMIADKGGTEAAITIDDPTNPEAIFEALEEIRRKALTCEMQIPQPPEGEPDYAKLNLSWTPGSSSAPELLAYDPTCSGPRSWHYDDENLPTKIELCPGICSDVTTSQTGKMDIVLGCATRPVTPN